MLNSNPALISAKRAQERAIRKQMDYMSEFQQNAQAAAERIETKLASRFPEESIHWTVVHSASNLNFSAKLVENDDYGRFAKEQFSSEIDGIFSECFQEMSNALKRTSEGKGGGFGA